MTEAFVVDASVAIKWVVPKADSERAIALLRRGVDLHAPSFLLLETANALWFKSRSGALAPEDADGCLADMCASPLRLWSGPEILPAAMEWACRLDHPVYDCAYLALALHIGCPCATADRKFWRLAGTRSALKGQVLLLDEVL